MTEMEYTEGGMVSRSLLKFIRKKTMHTSKTLAKDSRVEGFTGHLTRHKTVKLVGCIWLSGFQLMHACFKGMGMMP